MLIEKRSFKEDQNIEISYNQDTNLKNEFIKGHYSQTGTSMTYKLYLETLLYVINFLFDPRIENGTFKKTTIKKQRLRVVKMIISDLIWTVASLTIAMHY